MSAQIRGPVDFLKKCLRIEAKSGSWDTHQMTGSERAMARRLFTDGLLTVEQSPGVTSYKVSDKGKDSIKESAQ